MSKAAKLKLLEARLLWWRGKYNFRHKKLAEYAADVARSKKDKHPEALKRAEGLVRKWGPLEGEAAREIHALAVAIAKLHPKPTAPSGEGWSVPQTSWNPNRRKIANWIVRELTWAHDHGWSGFVTSGLRTFAEQKALYELFLRGGNIAAKPGESNHEGYVYPRGAIDTPQAEQLNRVLVTNRAHKLLWAETHGLADFVHFSGTGH